MPYTTNPRLPRLRMEAVRYVEAGHSLRSAARHFGYAHNTILGWIRRRGKHNAILIPTRSSKPLSHSRELSPETVGRIIEYRKKYRRCAEVLRHLLQKDGIGVSLSSVKRTLKRNHLTYPSKWKKWHQYPERPAPEKPGFLVEIDTIHIGEPAERLYVYSLLDVCSRWAQALPFLRIGNHQSLKFVKQAKLLAPFEFKTLQSDHGSEFSKWFTKRIVENGMAHRHSRVRTPTDNGHLERFNRTIQDECLSRVPRSFRAYQKEIPEYIKYYNTERPHMALQMKTPMEVVASY